ncbi:MAG: hypothetical protein ACFFED_14225 [Candidatus Thorarchaeota archaeon]
MKHAKKIVLSTVGVSLLVMFLLSLTILPSDAAAILDTPRSAAANVGNSFSVDAMGEALYLNDTDSIRALTNMHIEFTIVRNGSRGVIFLVSSGSFVMNYTRFSVNDGVGYAGRPQSDSYNRTLVFGFRLNLTDDDGIPLQLSFRGFVDQSEGFRPVLFMRGRITFENLQYYLVQRGTIHRIES